MGKRSSVTSNLKANRRKKRKRVERRKKHITDTAPLNSTYSIVGNHKGSVYRFFTEAEHADDFVKGKIRLSTLESFRKHDDKEQGDTGEAYETYLSGYLRGSANDHQYVEKARRFRISIEGCGGQLTMSNCSSTISIQNAYALSATTEFSPENMSEKIGNKFCVEIKDPARFFEAVSRKINSISVIRKSVMGKIIYTDRHYTGLEESPGPIGFVKPKSPYEKQKEFRFLWHMQSMDNLKPFQINCPEISKLCERIS